MLWMVGARRPTAGPKVARSCVWASIDGPAEPPTANVSRLPGIEKNKAPHLRELSSLSLNRAMRFFLVFLAMASSTSPLSSAKLFQA